MVPKTNYTSIFINYDQVEKEVSNWSTNTIYQNVAQIYNHELFFNSLTDTKRPL